MRLASQIASRDNRCLAPQGRGLARTTRSIARQLVDHALDERANVPKRCTVEPSIVLLTEESGDERIPPQGTSVVDVA
jgi:hypothetical protein